MNDDSPFGGDSQPAGEIDFCFDFIIHILT